MGIALGPLVVLGPLLNGSWDLWAQSSLILVSIGLLSAWAWVGLAGDRIVRPAGWPWLWAVGLGALGALSAYAGPLSVYAAPAWRVWLAGLAVIVVVGATPREARLKLDRGVRAAAWLMLLLAVYQHVALGMERPFSTLLNQNVLAAALLLLIPLAYESRDWVLLGLALLCLAWSRSVGAWLALCLAALVFGGRSRAWRLAAGAGVALCLALAAAKIWRDPHLANRWLWWSAALRMAWDRPWLGFGPGTFAYVLPAYVPADRPLGTLFGHQHYLQTAAECGWPYLAAWVSGLAALLSRGAPAKRAGALALLVHSLWDYGLAIPGVFWLFCRFAADGLEPPPERAWSVGRRRLAALGVAVAAAGASFAVWRPWQAERLRVRAQEAAAAGASAERVIGILERSEALSRHPETERLAARVKLAAADAAGDPAAGRRAAAADLERSVEHDPYRGSTWMMLEALYRQDGREDLARETRRRGALTCPGLRAP